MCVLDVEPGGPARNKTVELVVVLDETSGACRSSEEGKVKKNSSEKRCKMLAVVKRQHDT